METFKTQEKITLVKQNGLAPIVIVLLMAVLAVGGYLIYSQQSKPTSPQQTTQSVPNSSPTSESSVSTDTVNWKTYATSGYSITYPPDYLILSDPVSERSERDVLYNTKTVDGKPLKVTARESNTSEMLTIDYKPTEQIDGCDVKPGSYESQGKCIQVGSNKAQEYNTNNYYGPIAFNYDFVNKGVKYTLGFLGIEKDKKDQILSTFKFAN